MDAGYDAVFLQAPGGAAHGTPELGIGEDAPHTASLVVQLPHGHTVSKAWQVLLQEPPGRYVRIFEPGVAHGLATRGARDGERQAAYQAASMTAGSV